MPKAILQNIFTFSIFLILVAITGCNLPGSPADTTPTLNVTQAYQTVEAKLTQAVSIRSQVSPTPSATQNTTPTSTMTPVPNTATAMPTVAVTTPPPKTACDLAAPGVPIDVTIPDDTQMQPEQSFTKVWRLQNIGSCTWMRNYSIAIFSGEVMGAPASVPLSSEVAPGKSVDISIDMVAPKLPGTYQGNWKLRNASNAWFGIGPNGGSPFWVRIVVVVTPTVTLTPSTPTPTTSGTPMPTSTGTPTLTSTLPPSTGTPTVTSTLPPNPTSTSTEENQIGGSVQLNILDRLNLDNKQTNTGAGDDLSYETNFDGLHMLAPLGGAQISTFGFSQPTKADCQSAPLSGIALAVESMDPGLNLCYRTNQGLPGYAVLISKNPDDFSIVLQIQTWTQP